MHTINVFREKQATQASLSKLRLGTLLIALLSLSAPLCAQQTFTFNSGSTGADGAYHPTQNETKQLPESGVFNFTTVIIPSGVTIRFAKNAKNTPITILASGDVTIAGYINIEGAEGSFPSGGAIGFGGKSVGGLGGPGGFNGGGGGLRRERLLDGVSGDGPGGGGGGKSSADGTRFGGGGGAGFFQPGGDGSALTNAVLGAGGNRYSSFRLLPLVGGSGGGGGSAQLNQSDGYGGGGGGGAILIASSGKITFTDGYIYASGGSWNGSPCSSGPGGGGAGGAVRLVATTISGRGYIYVNGGNGTNGTNLTCAYAGAGSPGYVRIDAYNFSNFVPDVRPNLSFATIGIPTTAVPANMPALRIASVAGTAAPAVPVGSFGRTPDIILPTTQTNPVTVAIEGANLSVGTMVNVTVTSETGKPVTVQSSPLAGTSTASTASASVTLTPGYNLIHATATIDLPLNAKNAPPLYLEGERVKQIEVGATFQGESSITFITESGKRIKGE